MDIAKGFKRIGIVISAIPLLIGVSLLAFWAYRMLTTERGPWDQYNGTLNALIIGSSSLAIGVGFYLASWAIGWIVRGFTQKAV